MFKISLITMIIISFPEAMLIATLSLLIVGVKPTIKQLALFGILQAVFSYLVRSFPIDLNIIFLIQLIFSTINMYFVFAIPYSLSAISVLIGLTVYMGIEAVSTITLFSITGFTIQKIYASELLRLMFFIPQGVVTIFAIFLINKFNVKLPDLFIESHNRYPKNIKKFFLIIVVMVAQTMIFSLIFASNFLISNYDFYNQGLFSGQVKIVCIIILLQGLLFVLIKRVILLIQNDIETQAQLDSYRHINELINTVRAQKHNFCHDLQVTYGLLEVDEISEAKKYIKEALEEIAASSELFKSDNLNISALLQTKISIAESKRIKVEFDLRTSLGQLPIPDRQFNLVIGNILDNAIEAVEEQPIEDRKIAIEFYQDESGYIFIIKNMGNIPSTYLQEIFKMGVSTKGEGRGIGLYSVNKMIEKYKGKIHFENADNMTICKIWLPLK